MTTPKRILALVASRALFDKLEPLLGRSNLDVSTVTSGKSSLVLLNNLAFDLVLIEHPLPDLELEDLLAAMRGSGSPTRETPVLVVTHKPPEGLAERCSDPRLTCCSSAAAAEDLLAAAGQCLGVAVRRATRLLVQIEVELGPAQILRACQSVNISESGLLLRTRRPPPLETDLKLSFDLPRAGRTITARGRVVRHASEDSEGGAGFGVCFTDLQAEDRELLAAFIGERSATLGTAAAASASGEPTG